MPRGKIKMYNDDKGFGFIRPDNGDPDVFFHVSSLREGDDVALGKEVTFESGRRSEVGQAKGDGGRFGLSGQPWLARLARRKLFRDEASEPSLD